ncbi:MAG: hypothetical protein AAB605_04050 [Patescibacteria group bacterium]
MIRPIIIALFAFTLVALIGLWVVSGGPRRTFERISNIEILGSGTPEDEVSFRLPWQPVELFPTLDITNALNVSVSVGEEGGLLGAQNELDALEAEYERLNREASQLRTFGAPSPSADAVSIAQDTLGIRESTPEREYVEIVAGYQNDAPISLAGWYLESALSRTRIPIPPAAAPFIAGATNTLVPVTLEPGGRVVLVSGSSPVGISFRENACTGYLEQFQSFELSLPHECPSPRAILPLTEENLRLYGDSCFDTLSSLAPCEFPQNLPDTLWPSCRAFLADTFSYNGCVARERSRPSFNGTTWRIYLGAGELWRNSHDAIRLLDAQGRTVDVFVY